jgi:glycine dehydrogenase
MDIANASLLDEATAAGEAMMMSYNIHGGKRKKFFLSDKTFPQTIGVIRTRCESLNIELEVGEIEKFDFSRGSEYFGLLVQNPDNFGNIHNYTSFAEKLKENKIIFTVAADPLSLALTMPPGEMGADIAVGSAQRMGIPMMFGGPHPGFFAVKDKYKRKMPGRVIGISQDVHGNQALRMAMQTREQHIRKDKATSNICTAQALLANISSFYMQWHGAIGLRKMAKKCRFFGQILMEELELSGYKIVTDKMRRFDTIAIDAIDSGFSSTDFLLAEFHKREINIRKIDERHASVSFDETSTLYDLDILINIFKTIKRRRTIHDTSQDFNEYEKYKYVTLPEGIRRESTFMQQPQFMMKFSETYMMRYTQRLASKDISLTDTMIPLGSCTMKLNPAASMIPITWSGFANVHPYVPRDQSLGYIQMIMEIEDNLTAITQYDGISM